MQFNNFTFFSVYFNFCYNHTGNVIKYNSLVFNLQEFFEIDNKKLCFYISSDKLKEFLQIIFFLSVKEKQ